MADVEIRAEAKDFFDLLNDENFFGELVSDHFGRAPREISAYMTWVHELDRNRILYAHKEYLQNIEKFSLLLESSNPDHYKRSGALLHALYQSKIITNLVLENTEEDIETGWGRVPHSEKDDLLQFMRFYKEYHNEMISFDLAYRICCMYEDDPVFYDFDYLHNLCFFLWKNDGLSIDTCFIIFKSLMNK